MIHVIATIETAPGMRDDFLAAFAELVPDVRAEQGCIEYGPAVDLATSIGDQPAAAGKRGHRDRKMGQRRGAAETPGSTPHDPLSSHREGHRPGGFDSGARAGLIIIEGRRQAALSGRRFGLAADANSPLSNINTSYARSGSARSRHILAHRRREGRHPRAHARGRHARQRPRHRHRRAAGLADRGPAAGRARLQRGRRGRHRAARPASPADRSWATCRPSRPSAKAG